MKNTVSTYYNHSHMETYNITGTDRSSLQHDQNPAPWREGADDQPEFLHAPLICLIKLQALLALLPFFPGDPVGVFG